ncbi:GNAT family N-acetyltransferase [Roseibium aggregatum]|uniref:GNAT family N-acetyltransferase n=1 Tax=Roseibium aggregatum TaxID=187304 RepID=UPI0012F50F63|nr:GNAT family N-acetyltransferase [Roseibium aggregatum]
MRKVSPRSDTPKPSLPPNAELRDATSADLDALAALSIEVWLDTYALDGIPDNHARHVLRTYSPQAFAGVLQDPDKRLIVCRTDAGLLGYLQLDLEAKPVQPGSGTVEIETLYVRRHHQGMGVGCKLLEAACRLVRQAGQPKFFLTVYEGNEKAIGFYKAQGLIEEGRWTFDFEGGSAPNLIMTRDLSDAGLKTD